MKLINKKGYDIKFLVVAAVALLVGAILIIALLRGVANPLKKETTCKEDYCVDKATGCARGEKEITNKECRNSALICCMTPEELLGLKKPGEENALNTTNVILPNSSNTSNISNGSFVPVGKVMITLGEAESSLVGSSRQLKVGFVYTFKISNTGAESKCDIKVLSSETLNSLQETWIVGAGTSLDCRTTKSLVLTPGLQQINKQYQIQVTLFNASGNKVDTAVVDLLVIPNYT